MRSGRHAAAVALIAAATYLTALPNRFTLDDEAIVEKNPAAHDVRAALRAFDEPYWPPEHAAGQWRPLLILSFAVDWTLSGGDPLWLHAANVIWHAGASALIVPVLAAYASPAATLAGAAVFAVHPVHVEAVANLVGRAEPMVAAFLFAAVLAGRAARRRRAAGQSSAGAEASMLAAVAAALLVKEHAAAAPALLLLDDLATRNRIPAALPLRSYLALLLLAGAWFLARTAVEGGLSFSAVAPTFYQLDAWGRFWTMMPVVLVLVRLFVWPLDLSPDYHPQVIQRLEGPSAAGVLGLTLLLCLIVLAVMARRRHRAASVALAIIGVAWLPTSNLLFPTGIVLAERTLYLASAALALLVAALWDSLLVRLGSRRSVALIIAVVVALGLRSATAAPRWRSNRDLVVHALLTHPESYRAHQAAARVFRRLGERQGAMREYAIGAELFPLDHHHAIEAASLALELEQPGTALQLLRSAERLDSDFTLTHQLLAHAYLQLGRPDSALRHARRAVETGPERAQAARMLAAAWVRLEQPESALAVWPAFGARGGSGFERWLFQAATYAALGLLDSAAAALQSARALAPVGEGSSAQLREVESLVGALREAAPVAESQSRKRVVGPP
jgi:tetratricopeptide (TPR) repeat protein